MKRSLLLLPFLLFAQLAFAIEFRDTSNDSAWIAYLRAKERWVFNQYAYGGTVPEWVSKETTLIGILKANRNYAAAYAARPEPIVIKIEAGKYVEVPARVFQASELALIQRLSSKPIRGSDLDLKQFSTISVTGALTGLAAFVPNEMKKTYFSQPDVEVQINMLREFLPGISDADFNSKFQFARVGLTAAVSKQQILDVLSTEAAALKSAVRIALASARKGIKKTTDVSQKLMDAVNSREGKDAGAKIRALLAEKEIDLPETLASNADLKRVYEGMIRADGKALEFAGQDDQLILREVKPELGIFRGVCGADCSSGSSFVHAYAPAQRVFLVYRGNRNVGYISAILVKIRGSSKKVMLIKDMEGPKVPTKWLDGIVYALDQVKGHYGVTEVIYNLPFMESQSHQPHLTTHKQTLLRGEYVEVEWDALQRDIVRLFSDFEGANYNSYDDVNSHSAGNRLPETTYETLAKKYKAEIVDEWKASATGNPGITVIKTLEFLAGQEVLPAPENQNDEVLNQIATLLKTGSRDLDTYYAELARLVQQLDIKDFAVGTNWVHRNRALIKRGHLLSLSTSANGWNRFDEDVIVDTIFRDNNFDLLEQAVQQRRLDLYDPKIATLIVAQLSERTSPTRMTALRNLVERMKVDLARLYEKSEKKDERFVANVMKSNVPEAVRSMAPIVERQLGQKSEADQITEMIDLLKTGDENTVAFVRSKFRTKFNASGPKRTALLYTLIRSGNEPAILLALEEMVNGFDLDREVMMQRELAKLLDNTKAENLDISRHSLRLLSQIQVAEASVLQEVYTTLRDEDDSWMRITASFLYLRSVMLQRPDYRDAEKIEKAVSRLVNTRIQGFLEFRSQKQELFRQYPELEAVRVRLKPKKGSCDEALGA